MRSIKGLLLAIVVMFAVSIVGYTMYSGVQTVSNNVAETQKDSNNHVEKVSAATDSTNEQKSSVKDEWKHPSEKKDYPDLTKFKDAFIRVSLDDQKVYIQNGKDILYTMKAATGEKGSETPKGTFEIQNRGDHFYNAESDEGANYWTSFKDWGVYLFHSVPTDKEGNYVESEAEKLGTPSSHGCVRLTIPDAKWINSTVPSGMKVIVE
ncbi:L,D-transpeptidase [Companilactobacillus ginsenosidimutans]|uniref:L,D-TPase catalytic domain-containing protein n=1 Tax=Companilactobacillus ginsenosidimutans TaxID=1007676 RepID=A0A0H4QE13_9LACO|nr:L,D-transpeptidase [Companilactobacillus ginsenosidimutans]AKP66172.1 hypothetical protein ABM34_00485 [Companilactobacillus ginsenosidimutans]